MPQVSDLASLSSMKNGCLLVEWELTHDGASSGILVRSNGALEKSQHCSSR